jgi:hypothetical protein
LRSKILAFFSWNSPSVIGLTTRGSLRDEVDQREVGPGKKSGQSLALRAPIVEDGLLLQGGASKVPVAFGAGELTLNLTSEVGRYVLCTFTFTAPS